VILQWIDETEGDKCRHDASMERQVTMTKSDYRKVGLVMLFVAGAVQFIYGIVAGIVQEWMRMALSFTTLILLAVFAVAIGLSLKIDRSTERIEKLILEKPGGADSQWSKIDGRGDQTNQDGAG
jgi:hypothetical protein